MGLAFGILGEFRGEGGRRARGSQADGSAARTRGRLHSRERTEADAKPEAHRAAPTLRSADPARDHSYRGIAGEVESADGTETRAPRRRMPAARLGLADSVCMGLRALFLANGGDAGLVEDTIQALLNK